jgi:hypothetical protein
MILDGELSQKSPAYLYRYRRDVSISAAKEDLHINLRKSIMANEWASCVANYADLRITPTVITELRRASQVSSIH